MTALSLQHRREGEVSSACATCVELARRRDGTERATSLHFESHIGRIEMCAEESRPHCDRDRLEGLRSRFWLSSAARGVLSLLSESTLTAILEDLFRENSQAWSTLERDIAAVAADRQGRSVTARSTRTQDEVLVRLILSPFTRAAVQVLDGASPDGTSAHPDGEQRADGSPPPEQ